MGKKYRDVIPGWEWLGVRVTGMEGVQHNDTPVPSLRGAKRRSNSGRVLVTEIATPQQVGARNDTCYVIARSRRRRSNPKENPSLGSRRLRGCPEFSEGVRKAGMNPATRLLNPNGQPGFKSPSTTVLAGQPVLFRWPGCRHPKICGPQSSNPRPEQRVECSHHPPAPSSCSRLARPDWPHRSGSL